jgi:hypothetical protein
MITTADFLLFRCNYMQRWTHCFVVTRVVESTDSQRGSRETVASQADIVIAVNRLTDLVLVASFADTVTPARRQHWPIEFAFFEIMLLNALRRDAESAPFVRCIVLFE